MPAKMMSEMPLPMPRSFICSPSRQRDHRGEPEHPSRVQHYLLARRAGLALQPDGYAQGLDDTQNNGAVARILGYLLATRLALLGESLEIGHHHGHELQDDGGGYVGHDTQGENRHARRRAAGKYIEQPQQAVAGRRKQRLQGIPVDSRRGNMGPDAIDRQHHESKEQPAFQLGDFGDVG